MRRWIRLALTTALIATTQAAHAHDPSAWGGLFRSRDDGASWLPADAGLFVGSALAIAVSPVDAGHLLYATDARLLRSKNGGRDWAPEAPEIFRGPTLALAFAADGRTAWAATPAGVFAADGDEAWKPGAVPDAAVPARALAPGVSPARVYLQGARGMYVSTDHGKRFTRTGADELPDAPGRGLVVVAGQPETVLIVSAGRIWASVDGGTTWQPRDAGLPQGHVEAIAADRDRPGRLWAATEHAVNVSEDGGGSWRQWGQPVGEAAVSVHAIATAQGGTVVLLATQRGLLRSSDAGRTWTQLEGALPVHLEAGPLVADPHDAQTVYAGFSLVPYPEIWRRAEQGSNLLSQLDPVSIAGAIAFLLLLLIGGALGARGLARAYRDV
jgi:hypothetical protein